MSDVFRAPPNWVEFGPDEPGVYQLQVLALIESFTTELEDEFGKFTTLNVQDSQRVILVPEQAEDRNQWFVCYLSDPHADARLVVDDYVPETER